MIIGIDEVGDFNLNSDKFNYFIAVHFNQYKKNIDIKRNQFEQWKQIIPPSKLNKNDEVKGKDLADVELISFAKQVINIVPIPLITQIRVIPNQNPKYVIEAHKQFEIDGYLKVIEKLNEIGKFKLAGKYEELTYWYKNLSLDVYLKIKVLSECICHSLNKTIGVSVILNERLGDFDNIMNISYKIDKGFINGPSPFIFFSDYLRHVIMLYSKEFPVPIPKEWRENNHLFIQKNSNAQGKIILNNILRKRTNFLDSNTSFEIQIADIVGSIIHKFQNRNYCSEAYALIANNSKRKYDIVDFSLNENFGRDIKVVVE